MPYPVNAANVRACTAISDRAQPKLLSAVGRALVRAEFLPEGNISENLKAILNGTNDAFVNSDPRIKGCRDLFDEYFSLRNRLER